MSTLDPRTRDAPGVGAVFDSFKTMQALGSLMKNKDELARAAERVGAALDALEVEGESGSGACRAVVTGKMRVVRVTLDPSLATGMGADARTRELAQTLIAEAVNDANANARKHAEEIIRREADSLGLGALGPDALGGPGGLAGLLG